MTTSADSRSKEPGPDHLAGVTSIPDELQHGGVKRDRARVGVWLERIEPQHIASFYREQFRHVSPGSVRRLHALLHRSFTVAVRWGLATSNPVTMVDPPSLQRQQVEPLRIDEVRRLLRTARETPHYARWLIASTLGLRPPRSARKR